MILKSLAPFLTVTLLTVPAAADSCTFLPKEGSPLTAEIPDLAPGTFAGQMVCGDISHVLAIWTTTVDPGDRALGVRDEPLFQAVPANPLTPVAQIGYDHNISFTFFRRIHDTVDKPHRVFATICAGGSDPLNCSLGDRRIKVRVDLRDPDQDGQMDRAYHQISIYNGADRLQVIFVDLPAVQEPQEMVGDWIAFFGLTGAVDLDQTL